MANNPYGLQFTSILDNAQSTPTQSFSFGVSPQMSIPTSTQTANTTQSTATALPNVPQKATLPSVPKINPVNYNIPTPTSIDSTMLSTKPTVAILDNLYNQKQQDMITGANANYYPTDKNYENIATASPQSELYQRISEASIYSPEEQQALQQYNDTTARINATNLANRRQIKQMQENGQLTKEQASAFITEEQRRADAQMADLATAQSASALSLDVLGKIRANQLGAYQTQYNLLKPEQVAIGSTLYNPIQGVMYQPGGQATSEIAQALVDGTLSPANIPSGVNPAVVYQQANEISMRTKGTPFNANEAQANFQAQQAAIQQNATTYRTLANAQQAAVSHLDEALGYAKALKGTTSYPLLNTATLSILRGIGNKTVGQYDTALSIARSEVAKVLGGGQVTVEGMQEAENILPSNLGADQLAAKVETIKKLMQEKIAEYGNLSNIPQFGQTQQSQQTGTGVVQTKAGIINTNW